MSVSARNWTHDSPSDPAVFVGGDEILWWSADPMRRKNRFVDGARALDFQESEGIDTVVVSNPS